MTLTFFVFMPLPSVHMPCPFCLLSDALMLFLDACRNLHLLLFHVIINCFVQRVYCKQRAMIFYRRQAAKLRGNIVLCELHRVFDALALCKLCDHAARCNRSDAAKCFKGNVCYPACADFYVEMHNISAIMHCH